jgi:hypothetical protein
MTAPEPESRSSAKPVSTSARGADGATGGAASSASSLHQGALIVFLTVGVSISFLLPGSEEALEESSSPAPEAVVDAPRAPNLSMPERKTRPEVPEMVRREAAVPLPAPWAEPEVSNESRVAEEALSAEAAEAVVLSEIPPEAFIEEAPSGRAAAAADCDGCEKKAAPFSSGGSGAAPGVWGRETYRSYGVGEYSRSWGFSNKSSVGKTPSSFVDCPPDKKTR